VAADTAAAAADVCLPLLSCRKHIFKKTQTKDEGRILFQKFHRNFKTSIQNSVETGIHSGNASEIPRVLHPFFFKDMHLVHGEIDSSVLHCAAKRIPAR